MFAIQQILQILFSSEDTSDANNENDVLQWMIKITDELGILRCFQLYAFLTYQWVKAFEMIRKMISNLSKHI